MSLLKRGSHGAGVKELQELLNLKLGINLVADGIFGKGTEDAVERFQRRMSLTVDGLVGSETLKVLRALRQSTVIPEKPVGNDDHKNFANQDTGDRTSERTIAKIHPQLFGRAKELIIRLKQEKGITIRAYSGFRSYAQQNELFAKGRTTAQLEEKGIFGVAGKPNDRKVTKVLAGNSFHNFGLAIDVVEIKNGKALWSNPNWEEIGAFGESIGWEWGGRWTSFVDRPHFEFDFGLSRSQLRAFNDGSAKSGSEVKLK